MALTVSSSHRLGSPAGPARARFPVPVAGPVRAMHHQAAAALKRRSIASAKPGDQGQGQAKEQGWAEEQSKPKEQGMAQPHPQPQPQPQPQQVFGLFTQFGFTVTSVATGIGAGIAYYLDNRISDKLDKKMNPYLLSAQASQASALAASEATQKAIAESAASGLVAAESAQKAIAESAARAQATVAAAAKSVSASHSASVAVLVATSVITAVVALAALNKTNNSNK